jgi:hypothetical protein
MKGSNLDFLQKFSKEDYKRMRDRMITMVLATDMSFHFQDIGRFKGRIATGKLDHLI